MTPAPALPTGRVKTPARWEAFCARSLGHSSFEGRRGGQTSATIRAGVIASRPHRRRWMPNPFTDGASSVPPSCRVGRAVRSLTGSNGDQIEEHLRATRTRARRCHVVSSLLCNGIVRDDNTEAPRVAAVIHTCIPRSTLPSRLFWRASCATHGVPAVIKPHDSRVFPRFWSSCGLAQLGR